MERKRLSIIQNLEYLARRRDSAEEDANKNYDADDQDNSKDEEENRIAIEYSDNSDDSDDSDDDSESAFKETK